MLHDLVNATSTSQSRTPLSSCARKLLVGISAVLAMGLAGVVLARTSETRPAIVWVLRGAPILVSAPVADPTPEADQAVVLENNSFVESADQIAEPEHTPISEATPDEPAQLATMRMSGDGTSQLAKQRAAGMPLPAPSRRVMMEVTAYCPCTKCCGPKAQGITASGKDVSYNNGKFVAGDRALPFGTRVIIPGYGNDEPVEVIDRGGAIKGDKLDVFFPTHQEALQWGRQKLPVIVQG